MSEKRSTQQTQANQASPKRAEFDLAEALAAPVPDLQRLAKAQQMTLAQLAMALSGQEARKILKALHEMFATSAELGVARTRAEAAVKLERLVRQGADDATPDQVRRLLIDVLKLGDRRSKPARPGQSEDETVAPMSDTEQAALRTALERAARAGERDRS